MQVRIDGLAQILILLWFFFKESINYLWPLKSVELVQNHQLVKEAGDRVFIFHHDISSVDPLPRSVFQS